MYSKAKDLYPTELNNSSINYSCTNTEVNNFTSTSDPNLWGPCLWFTLHNASIRYAKNPSDICKKYMKGFIIGLPLIIPCELCADHARAFIESRDLDETVSTRDFLFKFFVDFHNEVNVRYNKPKMDYQTAFELYSGKIKIQPMKYK
jgi:hypothetical protein